ncbi:hypothetical protein N784_11755 [Pontibacillus litoralis JSM 072002]|uniref:Uncharacterized protein n=1 Tax=Pontibacillus litoralis JSM 072002 TaxID=1385512 RepID=A0A0A5G197_9BACI|nr:hypothetical protein N784_11755 [Pontibacillus litoralis JSM 072002]
MCRFVCEMDEKADMITFLGDYGCGAERKKSNIYKT